jgi:hypothetical protein
VTGHESGKISRDPGGPKGFKRKALNIHGDIHLLIPKVSRGMQVSLAKIEGKPVKAVAF